MSTIEFTLPAALAAHEPPEARGLTRDGVRLLVGTGSGVTHRRFADLPLLLRAGDVLVVNTSATIPAALAVPDRPLTVHFSTERPDGRWLVEVRQRSDATTRVYHGVLRGERYRLPGGALVTVREPYGSGRLWAADVQTPMPVLEYLARYGRPIRYGYVARSWPLACYQTVFATQPGSAEMPSAGRPFTERLVTRLVAAGVQFAPVLLHTGVASPEAGERPYPERFAVGAATAALVNTARAEGRRVIAVGTTAVRALESAADDVGVLAAANGWTDLIVTPERGVRVVNGLVTGFHEPHASHLDLVGAIAGRQLLDRCYQVALDAGYLWHEFGDLNLLLPG